MELRWMVILLVFWPSKLHDRKSLSHVQLFETLWPIRPWNSPGWNTGVGSLSLLQGIFPTQSLNPGLPHCRWILYQLRVQERYSQTKDINLELISRKIPWGRHGNSLQYSCLENPMDGEAWWATVHGVAQSQTEAYTHRGIHKYGHWFTLSFIQ